MDTLKHVVPRRTTFVTGYPLSTGRWSMQILVIQDSAIIDPCTREEPQQRNSLLHVQYARQFTAEGRDQRSLPRLGSR